MVHASVILHEEGVKALKMAPKKCETCKQGEAKYQVCSSCLNSRYVMNSLLAYVATYIHRSTLIQLKLAVLGFYSEDEVSEAKQGILDATEHLDLGLKNINRQNSATRSAKEAEVDDIIGIFQKMDGNATASTVTFCVSNVSSLPPAAPEEGGSMMSLVGSMAKMLKQMQQLQQTVAEIRLDVNDHEVVINRHETTLKNMPMKQENMQQEGVTVQRKSSRYLIGPDMVANAIQQANRNSLKEVNNKGTYAAAAAAAPVEEDGFIMITGANGSKRPRKGLESGNDRARQKRLTGTADRNDNLKAGPELIHIQLTNVHPENDTQSIKDYIKDKDESIVVTEVKDTSNEGWETKRFIVTCNSSAHDKILSSDFWPRKIYYKRWYLPRQKPQADNS